MAEWVCKKCDVDMEDADDIKLIFGEVDLPPGVGFRCPQCKAEYLSSEFTTGELNSAEEMMEGK